MFDAWSAANFEIARLAASLSRRGDPAVRCHGHCACSVGRVRGSPRSSRATRVPSLVSSSMRSGPPRRPAASPARCSTASRPASCPTPRSSNSPPASPSITSRPAPIITDLVTPERVETGRALAAEHARLLAAIESTYGVDRHVLLAIWGVESGYGTAMGSRSVVRSLATLAIADTRRAAFWRNELIAALRILQDGQTAPETFVGSWAGATGHTQFIPSAYAAHAVDFDKDGRRDIWGNVADALASTANYLRTSGWSAGAPWGFEVDPADRVRLRLVGAGPVADAVAMAGGRRAHSAQAPAICISACRCSWCCRPARRGPAFLVTQELPRHPALQQCHGLRAGRRPSRRPHRRRGAAGRRLGRPPTSRWRAPSARSCSACWPPGATIPAASTASWATRPAPPSAPPSAPSIWPGRPSELRAAAAAARRRAALTD